MSHRATDAATSNLMRGIFLNNRVASSFISGWRLCLLNVAPAFRNGVLMLVSPSAISRMHRLYLASLHRSSARRRPIVFRNGANHDTPAKLSGRPIMSCHARALPRNRFTPSPIMALSRQSTSYAGARFDEMVWRHVDDSDGAGGIRRY